MRTNGTQDAIQWVTERNGHLVYSGGMVAVELKDVRGEGLCEARALSDWQRNMGRRRRRVRR